MWNLRMKIKTRRDVSFVLPKLTMGEGMFAHPHFLTYPGYNSRDMDGHMGFAS